MNQKQQYPDWFLWIWERGPFLFFGTGAVIALLIIVVGVYLDNRLDDIEERLVRVPPRSYQPPDLDDYQVLGVTESDLSTRQVVYAPVYSHIYYDGGSPCPLESTLSIRNVDLNSEIYLKSVRYFDTDGQLVKTQLDQLIQLAPLATIEFLVERRDTSGGSGANFLVEWLAKADVDKPLIETVMVGSVGTQGICFQAEGIDVSARKPAAND